MTEQTSEFSPGKTTMRTARVILASPEILFRLFADASAQKRWRGKTGKGTLTACDVDASVGGTFSYAMSVGDKAEEGSGKFIEISEPSRFVFSWDWKTDGLEVQDGLVTLEFMDLKDGSTRAVVTQENLVSTTLRPSQSALWSNLLQDMAIHAAEG